ncbi:hypothetical protein STAS_31700 [Striga asiatica]|uniref:Uncharacterized protein n=1 Tax=Striga asiatica TaxID=4170 RepID=A0A5A7RA05_STRAF|nr:hypothetical protein STAS_31700 [Striga asiatica]
MLVALTLGQGPLRWPQMGWSCSSSNGEVKILLKLATNKAPLEHIRSINMVLMAIMLALIASGILREPSLDSLAVESPTEAGGRNKDDKLDNITWKKLCTNKPNSSIPISSSVKRGCGLVKRPQWKCSRSSVLMVEE